MLRILRDRFPYEFTRDILPALGVSMRSAIRKARDLGLNKEPGFLDKKRSEINHRAALSLPPNPNKGRKGWSVPNSEYSRFAKGHIPRMASDPELVARVHKSRNESIRRDRLRIRLGLEPIMKLLKS